MSIRGIAFVVGLAWTTLAPAAEKLTVGFYPMEIWSEVRMREMMKEDVIESAKTAFDDISLFDGRSEHKLEREDAKPALPLDLDTIVPFQGPGPLIEKEFGRFVKVGDKWKAAKVAPACTFDVTDVSIRRQHDGTVWGYDITGLGRLLWNGQHILVVTKDYSLSARVQSTEATQKPGVEKTKLFIMHEEFDEKKSHKLFCHLQKTFLFPRLS